VYSIQREGEVMPGVPYSKPKLIYEGFVDGFLRIGRRDYIPISSIIMVIHNRGKLAQNLKKMYIAKGRFINIAREEMVRCYILVGLKGDSFCVSCNIDPVRLITYMTQWKLGKDVKDEDPWNGLREVYCHRDKYGRRTVGDGSPESEAEDVAGEDTGSSGVVSHDTNDLQAASGCDRGAAVCPESANL
jgi:hypothetical protein